MTGERICIAGDISRDYLSGPRDICKKKHVDQFRIRRLPDGVSHVGV